MTASNRPRRPGAQPTRPRAEVLEARRLMTGYYPAVADYDGTGVDDIAEFRYATTDGTQVNGRNSILIQSAASGADTGYEMGYTPADKPVSADFDGDGKADPAVYSFLDNVSYGNEYATSATGVAQPFPNGEGRFAYIPSSGVYPTHMAGSTNGTFTAAVAKVIIVNIGGKGDVPAVADYDADGKADFTVYEPSLAQFLFIPSSTFNPNGNPNALGNAPITVPLGKVGDLPASADFEHDGQANFAVYDAASGTFYVRSLDGGKITTDTLGGPGDIPVSADFDGVGHAEFAVYDPAHGDFLVQPADGSATRVVTLGDPGDTPVVGRYGDGHVDLATFNPASQQFQILLKSGIKTESIADPDAVGIERTDDYATGLHALYAARTASPNVMFLGDSITYSWPSNGSQTWNTRISPLGVSNNGINYDTTQNVLWRIENGELAHVHPKVIVLLIGTNDFIDRSPGQVAHSIQIILNTIHAESPGTSVLDLGVYPRANNLATNPVGTNVYFAAIANEIRELDEDYLPQMIKPFADRTLNSYPSGDYYINLRAGLSADPADPTNYYSNPLLTNDLVHPNQYGYSVVADALMTPLRLLLHRPSTVGDYDGDSKTDLAVYEPTAGQFNILYSSVGAGGPLTYGTAGAGKSIPAPGDYYGNGKTDMALYETADKGFVITNSITGTTQFFQFGIGAAGGTIPAVGDYDGDGKADMAVYEPLLGGFVIHQSTTGINVYDPFGTSGYGGSIPAPGDYDGDGRTDLAVYLPAIGAFGIRPSTGGPDEIIPFGVPGVGKSIPVPGDYDGSGKTELAVYMPQYGLFAYRSAITGKDVVEPFGIPGIGQSIPAPGDYDGDGRTDIAVYMPALGAFGIRFSALGKDEIIPYGLPGSGNSIPVTSSYDVVNSAPLGQVEPAGVVVTAASVTTATTAKKTAATARKAVATHKPTATAATANHLTQVTKVTKATPTGPKTKARSSQA